MTTTFADLGVPAAIAACLDEAGITSPFAIQTEVLPAALAGRDVCGRAPTGSGKTLGFGIPVVVRVEKAKPGKPRALILAPTRELAAQIERALTPIAATRQRRVAALYGGVGYDSQLRAIRRGVDIIVATPGRLVDFVERRQISLCDVQIVVVDEADRMADMGFLPVVRKLLDQTRHDRQTLLFSATLDNDVDVLIRHYQHNPIHVETSLPDEEIGNQKHLFWRSRKTDRVALTAQIVNQAPSTVVFCRTKRGADRLARQLAQHGLTVAAIHGDRSQSQREKALSAFQNRRVQALVATDVAARGIHVDGIDCVVHFDPPDGDKTYMHRSGRTGRAGATGTVVSFVDPADMAVLRAMQRQLGFPPGASEPDLSELTSGDTVPLLRIAPQAGTTLVATPPRTAVDRHQARRPRAPWHRSQSRRGTKR